MARQGFDLRLVAPFVALGEELHFGRAAARLRVGQPSLSRAIARLEADLGVSLVARDGGRVALTGAGARFLVEARALLTRAAAAEVEVRGIGELRVHLGHASNPVVRELFASFVAAHPGVTVRETSGTGSESVQALVDGIVDIGFDLPGGVPPGRSYLPLDRGPLGVVCPADHPVARAGTATWQAIAAERVFVAPPGLADAWNRLVSDTLRAENIAPERVLGPRVSAGQYLSGLIAAGHGVLVIARWEFDPAPPGVTWIQLTPRYDQEIGLFWDDKTAGAPAVAFVEWARTRHL